MAEFHRIIKSTDPKLPEWRLRVSAECPHEVDIAEELVHPEQIDNPKARHTKRRALVRATREEAIRIRDALTEWLAEHPDDGAVCAVVAGEGACRG